MGKYYAVYGKNGLGIYGNYSMAEKNRQYLQHYRCKRCDTYAEAENTAVDGYNSFQTFPGAIRFEGYLEKLNWTEYPYLRRKAGFAMIQTDIVKPIVICSR